MNFKSSQPRITNFSYLLILAIIVGCTTRPNQEILVDNKPKTESTNPVTDLVVSPSASEIDNTPTDTTPATIGTRTAEIPNTIPEFTMLSNPGFESLDESGNPADWTHTGTLEAVTIEDRGHSGKVWTSIKRTFAMNKSQEEACNRAFLSAVIALQGRAQKEGRRSVVDIYSYHKKRKYSSTKKFDCEVGAMMCGVTLRGRVR